MYGITLERIVLLPSILLSVLSSVLSALALPLGIVLLVLVLLIGLGSGEHYVQNVGEQWAIEEMDKKRARQAGNAASTVPRSLLSRKAVVAGILTVIITAGAATIALQRERLLRAFPSVPFSGMLFWTATNTAPPTSTSPLPYATPRLMSALDYISAKSVKIPWLSWEMAAIAALVVFLFAAKCRRKRSKKGKTESASPAGQRQHKQRCCKCCSRSHKASIRVATETLVEERRGGDSASSWTPFATSAGSQQGSFPLPSTSLYTTTDDVIRDINDKVAAHSKWLLMQSVRVKAINVPTPQFIPTTATSTPQPQAKPQQVPRGNALPPRPASKPASSPSSSESHSLNRPIPAPLPSASSSGSYTSAAFILPSVNTLLSPGTQASGPQFPDSDSIASYASGVSANTYASELHRARANASDARKAARAQARQRMLQDIATAAGVDVTSPLFQPVAKSILRP
jgi:hypothetical protein